MDFLKIAIGNGVNISQLREWSSVPLDQIDNSSELAAIVIKMAIELLSRKQQICEHNLIFLFL